MATVQFTHTDWQRVRASHGDCRVWTCGTVVMGVYAPAGNRVAAELVTVCGGIDEGRFGPGGAEEAVARLAVAYPGMEVLVWADPFTAIPDRRSEAFEPAASSGDSR